MTSVWSRLFGKFGMYTLHLNEYPYGYPSVPFVCIALDICRIDTVDRLSVIYIPLSIQLIKFNYYFVHEHHCNKKNSYMFSSMQNEIRCSAEQFSTFGAFHSLSCM